MAEQRTGNGRRVFVHDTKPVPRLNATHGLSNAELAVPPNTRISLLLRKRPDNEGRTLPEHFADALDNMFSSDSVVNEYTTRYLRRIGALPSERNKRLVLRHLPLDQGRQVASWSHLGADKDALSVYPVPHRAQHVDGNGNAGERAGVGVRLGTHTGAGASNSGRRGKAGGRGRGRIVTSCAAPAHASMNAAAAAVARPITAAGPTGGETPGLTGSRSLLPLLGRWYQEQQHHRYLNKSEPASNRDCATASAGALEVAVEGSETDADGALSRFDTQLLARACRQLTQPPQSTLTELGKIQADFAASVPQSMLSLFTEFHARVEEAHNRRFARSQSHSQSHSHSHSGPRFQSPQRSTANKSAIRSYASNPMPGLGVAENLEEGASAEAVRARLKEMLQLPEALRIFGLLLHYIYWSVLRVGTGASGDGASMHNDDDSEAVNANVDKQRLFVATRAAYAAIELSIDNNPAYRMAGGRCRSGCGAFDAFAPLFFLSLRVGVERVVQQSYPALLELEAADLAPQQQDQAQECPASRPLTSSTSPGAALAVLRNQGRVSASQAPAAPEAADAARHAASLSPTLTQCHDVIRRLLDPALHRSRLAMVERAAGPVSAACQAESRARPATSTGAPVRPRRQQLRSSIRDQYYAVSASVSALYSRPASGRARQMMRLGVGAHGTKADHGRANSTVGSSNSLGWYRAKHSLEPTARAALLKTEVRKMRMQNESFPGIHGN